MSVSRHLHLRRRRRCISTLTAFTFLLFFSAFSTTLSHHGNYEVQEREESGRRKVARGLLMERGEVVVTSEKRMSGPGSTPPTCRSKCGKCTPCEPVHVPIHPGLTMPLEYYPEAWRCKCGNLLFMP